MRNAVAWNALMTGCCRLNNRAEEALLLFDEMLKKGLEITDRTVVALISLPVFRSAIWPWAAQHMLAYTKLSRITKSMCSSALDMYSKCRCLASALKVFDNMRDRNVLTWSDMVAGFAIHDEGKAALKPLEEMVKEALWSNAVSYLHRIALCVLPPWAGRGGSLPVRRHEEQVRS